MEKRDSFIFYRSFFESIKCLTKTEQLQVFNAICEYSLNFNDTELTGTAEGMFNLMRPNLEANNKRFISGSKPKRKQTVSKREANKDKDKDKDKDIKNKHKEFVISSGVNVEAFEMWIAYKGKSYTKQGKTLSMNKLAKYDKATQQEMVENSIMNQYKGLFEPKQPFKGKNKAEVGSIMWQLEQEQKEKDYVDVQIESS